MTPPTPTPPLPAEAMLPTADAMRRALGGVVGCGGVLVGCSLLWLGWRSALSTLLGAGLAVTNLYVLGRVVQALLERSAQVAAWGVVGLLKLTLLFGGVWALFHTELVAALPLLVGYGALPLGITLSPLFLRAPLASSSTPASTSLP